MSVNGGSIVLACVFGGCIVYSMVGMVCIVIMIRRWW